MIIASNGVQSVHFSFYIGFSKTKKNQLISYKYFSHDRFEFSSSEIENERKIQYSKSEDNTKVHSTGQ